MGLGVQGWSVDECMQKFQDMCRTAFTGREFAVVPIMRVLAWANHGSKYKTKPFERVLKDTFDANRLLFGGQSMTNMSMKVAVTTTTYVDQRPVVFSNYNRPENKSSWFHPGRLWSENFADLNLSAKTTYEFHRPPGPHTQMKVWEA